ncbi:MAG: hypothetical protein ACLGH4_06255 [Actinomycetes bacterium]
MGLLEIADGFRLELPWMAWFFAALFLVSSWWLYRTGGLGPVVLLGALHLFELLMLIFVFRTAEQAPPAALWWLFVLVTAVGTAASVWSLADRRRAGSTA